MMIPGHSYRGELPSLTDTEHASSGRMRHDVTYLAETIGERNTCHPAELAKAEKSISDRFSKLGYSTRIETYLVGSVKVSNVEATLTGQSKLHEIIVIGAHYDSARETPGADDNASGVAVLLEIARHFKDLRPKRTIRFVAFVNEEPPYFQTDHMGSHVYARGCKRRHEKIVGMLCLESLGYYSTKAVSQIYPPPLEKLYPDTGDYVAFCGDVASYPLLCRCIKHFRTTTQFPSEGLVAPDKLFSVGWSDHWAFWQAGYPAIMITDTAFLRNPHYHLPSDIPETLDYGRMARVTEGLMRVILHISR
jgi:Zn-dependent M28 family amino/carboxypeptidase